MGKVEMRAEKLIAMLRSSGKAEIGAVVEKLGVSEATARRLFALLENEGKLIRIHGGVRLAPEMEYGYSFNVSASRRSREKSAIGEAAAEIIGSGDRLFLDSGTTVLRLAEALARRIETGELKGIQIVTNSLANTEILSHHCKVIMAGGEIRHQRRDACGHIAEKIISQYHFDKAFLGADAISAERGFMTSDELTAEICRIALSHSEKAYVLADSEKFTRKSFVVYASFPEVDRIFTDAGLPGRTESHFSKKIRISKAGTQKGVES